MGHRREGVVPGVMNDTPGEKIQIGGVIRQREAMKRRSIHHVIGGSI